MPAIFQNTETLDSVREIVTFPVLVNDQQTICAITSEALCDNFGAKRRYEIETFRANRHRIESKAERLIEQGRYEANNSILIYSLDGV